MTIHYTEFAELENNAGEVRAGERNMCMQN